MLPLAALDLVRQQMLAENVSYPQDFDVHGAVMPYFNVARVDEGSEGVQRALTHSGAVARIQTLLPELVALFRGEIATPIRFGYARHKER